MKESITKTQALIALADFLTGPFVVQHSINLSRSGMPKQAADEFFALRAKFRVVGYAKRDEAEVEIRKVLE